MGFRGPSIAFKASKGYRRGVPQNGCSLWDVPWIPEPRIVKAGIRTTRHRILGLGSRVIDDSESRLGATGREGCPLEQLTRYRLWRTIISTSRLPGFPFLRNQSNSGHAFAWISRAKIRLWNLPYAYAREIVL